MVPAAHRDADGGIDRYIWRSRTSFLIRVGPRPRDHAPGTGEAPPPPVRMGPRPAVDRGAPRTSQLKRRWLLHVCLRPRLRLRPLSFALRPMLQFAGSHRLTSILSFNTGVEAR